MYEFTGPERQRITSEAAKAAAIFLKAVKDPEADPAVAEARGALERFTAEVESGTADVEGCKKTVTDARARLHADIRNGKGSAKAWAAMTETERAVVEAALHVETAKRARVEAEANLVAARRAAIEAVLPAAGEAVRAAREATRTAWVAYLAAERALGQVRSRAGSLAVQGDHLRTAAAGGAR